MRTIRNGLLVLGLLALIGAPALAQRPGAGQGGRGAGRLGAIGMGGGLQLLAAPAVQQELKLTDEQVEKAQEALAEMREEMRGSFQGLRDLSPQERAAEMEKIQQEAEAKTKTVLDEILDEEQRTRFEQIRLQQEGLRAFMRPAVREKLAMTEDQKVEIAGIFRDTMAETRSLMQDLRGGEGGNFREAFQKMREIQDTAYSEALAAMTDEQKATWKEMTGEPFEMGLIGGRRGGRGPGNS